MASRALTHKDLKQQVLQHSCNTQCSRQGTRARELDDAPHLLRHLACSLRTTSACTSDSFLARCICFPRPSLASIRSATRANDSMHFFDIFFILSMTAFMKASVAADDGPPTSDVSSTGGWPATSENSPPSAPFESAHEQAQCLDTCPAFAPICSPLVFFAEHVHRGLLGHRSKSPRH